MSDSYKQILKSSSIIGGASVINILIGLVRMKIVALLLGPSGVGLIGLLQNVVNTASTISALGLNIVGTRQVAEAAASQEDGKLHATRRVLFISTIILGVCGAAIFWQLRSSVSEHVLAGELSGSEVGWLAAGVFLTVASGSQIAYLNGLRRVRQLALISIISALISSIAGSLLLVLLGSQAIIAFVVSAPLAAFLASSWFISKEAAISDGAQPIPALSQFPMLLRLGIPFMLSALMGVASQLAVRAIVQQELGSGALGQFQAAAMVSMTYIAVVLSAMGNDYYPRLTAVIDQRDRANRLVNEQTEVALLISAPIFLTMMAIAPKVMHILYSSEFTNSVDVLRLQIIGDILKVCGWPLGYIILASGDGKTFLFVEAISAAFFVGLSWLAVSSIGVEATGIAFIVMYAALLPMVYVIARMRTGFRWWPRNVALALILLAMSGGIIAASYVSEALTTTVGILAALIYGAYAVVRLGSMAEMNGPAQKLAIAGARLRARVRKAK